MDVIQSLIVGVINIINQVLGVILVIYSAIVGTFFGGISIAADSEDNASSGYLTFLCVAMVLTVVLYMLLITFGVLGSAFVITGNDCIQKAAIVLLIVSEVLIVFVVGINVAAIIFSRLYIETLVAGPYYFSYFYILNIVIVIYLSFKFLFQLVYIIGVFPNIQDGPPGPKDKEEKRHATSCMI